MAPVKAADAAAAGASEGSKASVTSKLWAYADVTRAPETKPTKWPENVRVDPATPISWLPAGWGQGIKKTGTGSDLRCYVDPNGKVFYHRAAIEKELGQKFSDAPSAAKDGAAAAAVAAAPLTTPPGDWPEWLPRDWRIAFRLISAGKVHKIFVRPNSDRFFWNKEHAEAFISGKGKSEGTPLNIGPAATASAAVVEEPTTATSEPKRRRLLSKGGSGAEPPKDSVSGAEARPFAESKQAEVLRSLESFKLGASPASVPPEVAKGAVVATSTPAAVPEPSKGEAKAKAKSKAKAKAKGAAAVVGEEPEAGADGPEMLTSTPPSIRSSSQGGGGGAGGETGGAPAPSPPSTQKQAPPQPFVGGAHPGGFIARLDALGSLGYQGEQFPVHLTNHL